MQVVQIKNLNFNYGENVIFNNFNLNISEGKFVTILGKNGSGKTTLAKILGGFYKKNILIYGENDYQNIKVIFDDLDFDGIVMNILINSLKGLVKKEISDRVIEVSKLFGFDKLLNKDYDTLCLKDKKIVNLGIGILSKPKVLVLDNILEGLDKKNKNIILKKLKKLKITVINLSNDVNDALISDEVVIIGGGKVLLKGSKKRVLEDENFFETYDMELPFTVNLSNKLKFYELIDRVYFDDKKLVDDLWK